jgi:predicted GIY-YIG superfamily endonuclease
MSPKKKAHRLYPSGKGALIRGMSGRLPLEILQSPMFEDKLKELMRRYAGIYALYKGKRLYYVGLSTDLHWRISRHATNRHAGRWDHFVVIRIKRVKYLKDIETLLHRLTDAPGNRVRGNVPKDADITRVLRAASREQQRILRGFTKALRRE